MERIHPKDLITIQQKKSGSQNRLSQIHQNQQQRFAKNFGQWLGHEHAQNSRDRTGYHEVAEFRTDMVLEVKPDRAASCPIGQNLK